MTHKPRIIPLARTDIDWGIFVSSFLEMTGRSPTRQLDQKGIQVGTDQGYLESLTDISRIRSENHLKHLFFSFLIEIEQSEILEIIKRTDLETIDNGKSQSDKVSVAIVSGSAYAWKKGCLEFCTPESVPLLRYIFDVVYYHLSRLGIFQLLKTTLPDQTLQLQLPKE